ncbi:unnamed protein product [Fusarium venenatum]|uniref:Uncharacterized protein n=1 Tax=Fusarium venenatum TaxID=56646 RepID=A0A2L2SXM5_9HYPO|nr:uncharacterized protein FVRRES_07118 [Fusarium venenatum]CEI62682.1 unnamed protein product [Fusarium venenatum]
MYHPSSLYSANTLNLFHSTSNHHVKEHKNRPSCLSSFPVSTQLLATRPKSGRTSSSARSFPMMMLPPRRVFAKRDLPQETRIIEPGMMVTKDFKEDRLNVHLKDDGTVSHVVKG